jgi:LCP family protein required for cell wall assembly
VLIGLGVFVVFVAALFGGAWWYLNYRFGQIQVVKVSNLNKAKPGQPFNVLLVGSDSRQFVNTPGGCLAFGCDSTGQGGQRSDVIIVARVVPATRQIEMLSIPRDTWVNIPGNVQYVSGQNRINVAFDSGPSLLVKTIQDDFHISINYFVEVNFVGLQHMVDAIGGVHLDFPYPVQDTVSGLHPTGTGCQLIHGGQALALVRSRHLYYYANGQWNADYGSDFSRIHNQQAFFRAVINQLNSQITNLPALNDFIGSAVHNLKIDQTFSRGLLVSLASNFHNFPPGALKTVTMPTVGPVYTSGGAEVLAPSPAADQSVIQSFLKFGSPPPKHATTATTGGTSSTTSASVTTTTGGPGTSSTTTTAPPTTTTAPGSQTTVTTVIAAPAGEAPIYNNNTQAWTPKPC